MSRTCSKYAAILMFLLPAPVHAADWWIVYAEGDRPAREVHYLDAESLDMVNDPARVMTLDTRKKWTAADLVDHIRIEGTSVYESAKAPAKAAFQYRIKCRERLVARTLGSQLWRHDRTEDLPDSDWTDIDGNILLTQIHAFACDPAKRDGNGMLRVTSDEPMAATWKFLWTDGTEPQWTSTRTVAEQQAEIDAKIVAARAALAQAQALAGASLQRIEIDRGRVIRDQQKLFAQMRQKAAPVLHSWMALPERDLVASWGVPHHSYDGDGSRFLYYGYGYTTMMVDYYGNQMPQESWVCHMTFEVRDGLIVDYRSHGNYCETAAANLPYGRPRE